MEIEFNTYTKILESNQISKSNLPRNILNSDKFKGLIEADILRISKQGRGFVISVNRVDLFEKFLKNTFPDATANNSKSGNIKQFRDSKGRKTSTKPIFLLRGFDDVSINATSINLKKVLNDYGVFAVVPTLIKYPRVCFVENLDTFLKAERLIGEEYLFIHKYGRIGVGSLESFEAEEVLVFVDFDFNGLDEYLRIKSVFSNVRLYVPDNYDELYTKYSKSLSENKAKMSKAVANSKEEVVINIREQVARNNRFLEQEILIDD